MKYWIIDAETNTKNVGETAVGDMAANPHCPANGIVLFGERQNGVNNILKAPISDRPKCLIAALNEKVLLIGHNIGFDLKYMMKRWDVLMPSVMENIYIWDTQQVAHLLSGQTKMYPSLDDCCKEIGFELKDDKIKEYWENGVETELIPKSELIPYLEHDLEATEAVFRHQYEIVSNNPKLFTLVKVKMDDILATTMMEWNGMQFDLELAQKLADINDLRIAMNTAMAMGHAEGFFAKGFPFNPMSNEHVSAVLFGGTYKMTEDKPVIDDSGLPYVYKSGARKGQVKTKKTDVEYKTVGMGLIPVGPETAKKGVYSVNDEVLSKYDSVPFVQNIKAIREHTKENETYYRGYSALVWHDGKIHGSIGHCGTRTGRNNHSKPNLGNVTREE